MRFRPVGLVFSPWIVGAAIGLSIAYVPSSDLLGLAVLLAGLLAVVGLKSHVPEGTALPFLLGYLVRAGLAIVGTYVMVLPSSQGDALWFEQVGWNLATVGDWASLISSFKTGAVLYSNVIAIVYKVFWRSPLAIVALNAFLGALVVRNVSLIAEMLWGKRAAVRAAWATAVFPTLVLYSAVILREAMVAYVLTLGTVYFVRWWQERRLASMVMAAFLYALGTAFHSGVFGALVVLTVVAVMTLAARRSSVFNRAVGSAVAAVSTAAVWLSGWGLEKLHARSLEETLRLAATGGAAYLQNLSIRSPIDLVWQLPVRAFYLLFTPFPTMVSAPEHLVGLLDAALTALIVIGLLRSWWRIRENRASCIVLAVWLCLIAVFGVATSNFGTAIRHRAKLTPLAIALLAPGWRPRSGVVKGKLQPASSPPSRGQAM